MEFRKPPEVATERLRLCPVQERHAAETAALMTRNVAEKLLSWRGPMTEQEALERIRASRSSLEQGIRLNYALELKSSGTLIGWLGYGSESTEAGTLDIGFWLGEAFQFQGYIFEAVSASLAEAAAFLRADRAVAEAFAQNRASISVLRRLGLVPVSVRRRTILMTGESRRALVFERKLSPLDA